MDKVRTRTSLVVDHVTIAGADLDPLRLVMDRAGLPTVYGGHHSNGETHVALVPFADGSYLELLSFSDRPPAGDVWWKTAILTSSGLCSWAVESNDVAVDVQVIASRGIPVEGPHPQHRRTQRGELAQFEVAFLGDGEPGAQLPLLIEDTSARSLRVPRPMVETGPAGIEWVVVAVRDLRASIERYRRAFDLSSVQILEDSELGCRVAHFPGTPVCLAEPTGDTSLLRVRVERHGEGPCGVLLRVPELPARCGRVPVLRPGTWFDRAHTWLHPEFMEGMRIGFVETGSS